MTKTKNILFIMCDQLRADYLSCMGHDRLKTPNIDNLAKQGLLFNRAYCQTPVCGGSRMNFYTGRYTFTNGATWNGIPLNLSEQTIGDYLKPLGYRVGLVGKTHMVADLEGMERLGIHPTSDIGIHLSQCGFEPYERDDGLWGTSDMSNSELPYNRYLVSKGYLSNNPWHDYANSAEGPNGEILSGWYLRNSHLPARVKEEDSETAYMTNRAIDFIEETKKQPWCLHLSYIKPHWPYIAPAPYNDIYGHNDIKAVNRHKKELDNPHPLLKEYMAREDSKTFSRDDVRANVIPTYMGLIKQIDDNLGRLFTFLNRKGHMKDTMIIFTSDHGDYLGDHWLGEKELFHEESVRIPFIVYDPDQKSNTTRGQKTDVFAESIDLLPTLIQAAGGNVPTHRLEGESLFPILHGKTPVDWRNYVLSESEYASRINYWDLGLKSCEARATMIRTDKWKFIFHEKLPHQLFDLTNDPHEFNDLGEDQAYRSIRDDLSNMMFKSLRRRKTRTTKDESYIRMKAEMALKNQRNGPVVIGAW